VGISTQNGNSTGPVAAAVARPSRCNPGWTR